MHGGARRLDEELLEQLGIAFNKRLQVLMTTALNAGPRQDLSGVMAKLTLQEKQRAPAHHTHSPAIPTQQQQEEAPALPSRELGGACRVLAGPSGSRAPPAHTCADTRCTGIRFIVLVSVFLRSAPLGCHPGTPGHECSNRSPLRSLAAEGG